MRDRDYMLFFPNCKIVKGANRSAIYDFQRNQLYFIPNELYSFIEEYNKTQIKVIKQAHNKKDLDIVNEYLTYLLDKEFIFLGDKKDLQVFDSVPDDWDYFGDISNAIIEYSASNYENIDKILSNLEKLKCIALQIISYDQSLELTILKSLLTKINRLSYLTNVEIIIPFNPKIPDDELVDFLKKNLRVDKLLFHSSNQDKVIEMDIQTLFAYSKERIIDRKCCGNIGREYFSFNTEHYQESKNYNSCLNKKIAIDMEGNIKNCPSMMQSFGNIKSTSLLDVYKNEGFNKLWNITKDKIHICKDCEFRYICTDCRAYLENPSDYLSKPIKCGYNPYTNIWSDWSTNSLKQKVMDGY